MGENAGYRRIELLNRFARACPVRIWHDTLAERLHPEPQLRQDAPQGLGLEPVTAEAGVTIASVIGTPAVELYSLVCSAAPSL